MAFGLPWAAPRASPTRWFHGTSQQAVSAVSQCFGRLTEWRPAQRPSASATPIDHADEPAFFLLLSINAAQGAVDARRHGPSLGSSRPPVTNDEYESPDSVAFPCRGPPTPRARCDRGYTEYCIPGLVWRGAAHMERQAPRASPGCPDSHDACPCARSVILSTLHTVLPPYIPGHRVQCHRRWPIAHTRHTGRTGRHQTPTTHDIADVAAPPPGHFVLALGE